MAKFVIALESRLSVLMDAKVPGTCSAIAKHSANENPSGTNFAYTFVTANLNR